MARKVKYVIIAKKKGKGQKVEEHEAYNAEAKDRIVEHLRLDNYKVKVLTKDTSSHSLKFVGSLLKSLNKM